MNSQIQRYIGQGLGVPSSGAPVPREFGVYHPLQPGSSLNPSGPGTEKKNPGVMIKDILITPIIQKVTWVLESLCQELGINTEYIFLTVSHLSRTDRGMHLSEELGWGYF